jgi:hypothetical protein
MKVQFFYNDMPGSVSGLPSTGFAENKNGELIMDLISSAEGPAIRSGVHGAVHSVMPSLATLSVSIMTS